MNRTNDMTCLIFLFPNRHLWFLLLFMLLIPFPNAFAGVSMLQDEQLHMKIIDKGVYLTELAVNAGDGSTQNPDKWISLVTQSEDETISRHLEILGIDWNQDSVHREIDKKGIVTSVMSLDGSLELKKHIQKVPGQYLFKLDLEFINHSSSPLVLDQRIGLQLGPGLGEYPVEVFGLADILYSYVEPVIFLGDEELQRFPFDQDADYSWYDVSVSRWAGLHSRYFALLLMPGEAQPLERVRVFPGSKSSGLPQRYLPKVVLEFELGTLLAGSKIERNYILFAGPKSKKSLIDDGYDFSGLLFPDLWDWMRSLSFALLWMLVFLNSFILNWGASIIILAVCMRLIIYPLAQRSLKSQQVFMDKQKTMQPELVDIKNNYKGEEQSEYILQLYGRHGVSPLAGLKPLIMVLMQFPIFVALFNVLGQTFELRDASFLWISTLAEPDRLFSLSFEIPLIGSYFNLLPVLMVFSALLMIFTASNQDSEVDSIKNNNWLMLLMASGFFVLFYSFPAGMVLYWTMANVLYLLQQRVVKITTKVSRY